MATVEKRSSPAPRQPSRLQRRAPASIKIAPASEWNVVIPLLSPLVQSPVENRNPWAEIKSFCSNNKNESTSAMEKPVAVMKKWQHPAAPFSYEPASFMNFISTGNFDR